MSEETSKKVNAVIEEIKAIVKEIGEMSEKLDVPKWELLPLLTHREMVILNGQLRDIHEHLDWIQDSLIKRKEAKE